MITGIHHRHRTAYGRQRITAELRRHGLVINHERVGRIMTELWPAGTTRRRRTPTSPAPVPAEPVTDLIGLPGGCPSHLASV